MDGMTQNRQALKDNGWVVCTSALKANDTMVQAQQGVLSDVICFWQELKSGGWNVPENAADAISILATSVQGLNTLAMIRLAQFFRDDVYKHIVIVT